jgi:hypothetical protein
VASGCTDTLLAVYAMRVVDRSCRGAAGNQGMLEGWGSMLCQTAPGWCGMQTPSSCMIDTTQVYQVLLGSLTAIAGHHALRVQLRACADVQAPGSLTCGALRGSPAAGMV